MKNAIAVVDLFAGPGGLGEGFTSLKIASHGKRRVPFRIALSVEKEAFAHKTLRLRSFFRLLIQNSESLKSYYSYVVGKSPCPYTPETKKLWDQAGHEAIRLEIGSKGASRTLHSKVRRIAERNRNWILIGGPPCQAYSLVGRARNKGKKGYKPEEDKRHFLYTHYLELIRRYRPAVFVMENVKGILSSKVGGSGIFARILEDLRIADSKSGRRYKLYSVSKSNCVYTGPNGDVVDPHDFIVRSELHGVPQARHRVIVVGIREDVAPKELPPLGKRRKVKLIEAIGDLPKLRSGLSPNDSLESWQKAVQAQAKRATKALFELESVKDRKLIRAALKPIVNGKLPHAQRGGLRVGVTKLKASSFARRLTDGRLKVVLNHEARGHMKRDLARYLYAAAYGKVKKISPSQSDFPKALAPEHRNWFSGQFADRFRVQLKNIPSTTITCHIAKDGHYYIHFDPKQCRSMTVREAARLQTFPDNYYFEGNRTEQYVQVGNAVPPILARRIARKVLSVLVNHVLRKPVSSVPRKRS